MFVRAVMAMGFLLISAGALAAPRFIDKDTFLTQVEAHLARGDLRENTLVGNFFHTGDRAVFIATVRGWLAGVVVDPGYLQATQGKDVPGFTQPAGWTGFAQSLVQSLENKYNGHIVLSQYDPAVEQDAVTAVHEAMHAYAFAKGLSIDNDDYGGPEFLSNQFILHLIPRLAEVEKEYFSKLLPLAFECKYDDVARYQESWATEVQQMEYGYVNHAFHDRAIAKQLLEHWGGKLDWQGYIHTY